MAVKSVNRILPDTYFKLVKQFPLTHIRDEDHLGSAHNIIDQLLRENLDEGAREYLNVLTNLVETYEDEHAPVPDASEGDVLRELLRVNKITQVRLSKKVGISQSTISAVLNGSRTLTKQQMLDLAKFFRVSPAAFLPG